MDQRDISIARSVAYKGVIDLLASGKMNLVPFDTVELDKVVTEHANMILQIKTEQAPKTPNENKSETTAKQQGE